MSDKRWENDGLEQGIARIRHLAEQIDHAHQMLTRNSELLTRDRAAIRAGALRSIDNFERPAELPGRAAVDERPERPSRQRRSRRR